MASKRKKNGVADAPNLDLLPVMALMTVLIPILLSMASFQKLAVVEINMPERSMMNADGAPPEVDDQALNLSVAVGNDYLEIWARGGSMPKIFADEIIEYRCQTGDNFRYHPRYQIRYINEAAATGGHKWVQDKSFSGGQAKCLDGTPIPDTYAKGEKRVAQKEAIIMAARSTEGANSEEEVFGDPARLLRSVYNASAWRCRPSAKTRCGSWARPPVPPWTTSARSTKTGAAPTTNWRRCSWASTTASSTFPTRTTSSCSPATKSPSTRSSR